MLFHISEDPGILEFLPRPSKYTEHAVVWAVDGEKVRNYLVPRECPRVTYYAGPDTTAEDAQRFLGASTAVVAIGGEVVESLSLMHVVLLSPSPGRIRVHR